MENLRPKFLLARKIGMTQIFKNDKTLPVTVLEALPAEVIRIKEKNKDGYDALILKIDNKLKEFRFEGEAPFKIGEKIDASIFNVGEIVNVRSRRKAKGFAGVVKRHGFAGGPRTHGQKDRERAPGSIGQRWPQRVRKGLKMAGRISPIYVTVKNLEIIDVLPEKNLILVKGSVPGPNKRLVELRSAFLANKGRIYLNKELTKKLKSLETEKVVQ
ncbi:MAG: 50S ribosomal protein L3 [Candidatus Parcubacteria bacterium]|nr:MAG: 50S ribosomal protein L3 [Candidatus Parcubacteria bacterium]